MRTDNLTNQGQFQKEQKGEEGGDNLTDQARPTEQKGEEGGAMFTTDTPTDKVSAEVAEKGQNGAPLLNGQEGIDKAVEGITELVGKIIEDYGLIGSTDQLPNGHLDQKETGIGDQVRQDAGDMKQEDLKEAGVSEKLLSDQDAVIATENVDIHSKSQADSAHAAAVGDDYDHITAEVQLTLPKRPAAKSDKKIEPEQAILPAEPPQSSNLLEAAVDGGKEPSGSPELEAQVVDLVDAVIAERAVPEPVEPAELELEQDQSASRSDDPPSLCEHTTAPEIETYEVSDVEIEPDEEEAIPPPPAIENDSESSPSNSAQAEAPKRDEKKNGSPPVIMTQVTATAPGHRRASGASGVRLLKVETMDQPQQKGSQPAFVNGTGVNGSGNKNSSSSRDSAETPPEDEDDEDNAKMSSVFEVIGARNMDEALIKMETLEAVTRVMRLAGLEYSNLIFGKIFDF